MAMIAKGMNFAFSRMKLIAYFLLYVFFQSLIIWYANKKEAIPKGICVERNRQAQKCLPVDVICTKLKSVTLWVQ